MKGKDVKVNFHTDGPKLVNGKVVEPPKGKDIKVNRDFKSTGIPKRK